ncbi:MAG: UDP-N-acetylmuramate dehydrogenase [Actinobacteria bacterium]|nr:UDP-N-acetylmuramate dehydrogenase [Actinomycetota bacterium]
MKICKNFPLSEVLWYKIGGLTRYFIEASDKEEVLEALDFVKNNKIEKVFIAGLGANLLFTDEYFDGAFIRIVNESNNLIEQTNNNHIRAFAGEILDNVIQYAFQNNLTGIEWAGGLPGTVGAAVRGNVGAFGGEIKDVLAEAELIKITGADFQIIKKKNSELNFSYRNSAIKENKNLIVLSATLKLKKATQEELKKARQAYLSNIAYRNTKHPMEYANCGSVFKNIEKRDEVEKILSLWPDIKEKAEKDWHGKISMGYVARRLGFDGFKIGSAQVSPKHCNFIVNLGGAKFKDVFQIIEAIKSKFSETFGFAPETEIEIVR